GLAFEVTQLPEKPPGAMYPDDVPIARVVGRGDGDLAGQHDEEVVRALTLADKRFARVDGAPGAACLEGGNLIVGQSRVRAVDVGSFRQRRRFALVDRGLRHSSHGRSTSATPRRAPWTGQSGGRPCVRALGHAASVTSRRHSSQPFVCGRTWRMAVTCGSIYTDVMTVRPFRCRPTAPGPANCVAPQRERRPLAAPVSARGQGAAVSAPPAP